MSVPKTPWREMALQADPLADRTIAALVGPWCDDGGPSAERAARLARATRWLVGRRTARETGTNLRAGLPAVVLFHAGRIAIQGIDRVVRLAVPGFSHTRMFTRVVGYHMLTRFLLDQTRPLGLPQERLNPMRRTVAGWKEDERAPRWVRRVEARLTTQEASWSTSA